MQASSGHRSARLLASSRIGSRSAISPPLPQKHTPLMVHPLSRTRSSSYSRFPPEPALSIQPVAERDGFARPGHVRDARKDGPNGPQRSGVLGERAQSRSRRAACATAAAREDSHLAQDVRHVAAYGVLAEDEPRSYLVVGEPLGDEPQDL